MAASGSTAKPVKNESLDPGIYLITYVLEFLTGIIMYLAFSQGSKRLKLHAMQAIIIGIASVILSFILGIFIPALGTIVVFLIWLYCLYLGVKAYQGVDVEVPYITKYLKQGPEFH